MNKLIFAIIGARAGSKGVINKNIRQLKGFPLIAYPVEAAKQSALIKRTLVSSDSWEILDTAKHYHMGIVQIVRPPELASDTATDLDWILHALTVSVPVPDILVHLRATTPFIDTGVINEAIVSFLQNPEATSLRSAHRLEESPYKMFIKDEEYFKPFMQGQDEFYNLPRQKFPTVYAPNGYVDILRPSHILKNHNLHGDKILAFETPKVVEIDSEANLKELEGQSGGVLYHNLVSQYRGYKSH